MGAIPQTKGVRRGFAAAVTPSPEGWRVGLEAGLHEALAAGPGAEAAVLGFALALARLRRGEGGTVLVCAAAGAESLMGLPFAPGLAGFGLGPGAVLLARLGEEKELLWCVEEALSCPDIAAVLALLPERERIYGLTASRRLALRAEAHKSWALLLRGGAAAKPSAARTRWLVAGRPSERGEAKWRVELLRARSVAPGVWNAGWEHETYRLHMAAALGD